MFRVKKLRFKAILDLLKSGLSCVVHKTAVSMCFNGQCYDSLGTFISRTTRQIKKVQANLTLSIKNVCTIY